MNGAAAPQAGEAVSRGDRPRVLAFPGRSFGGARVSIPDPVFVEEEYEGSLGPDVEKMLVDFGGLNPYGQPYYRIVWGYQRGHWIAGEYHLKYTDRMRHRERWHLEKWVPAESFGTPEQWYAAAIVDFSGAPVNVLGPYPSRGDYVRVIVFENYYTGEYVRPEAEMVREAIIRNRQHAEQDKATIRKRIEAEMAEKRKASEQRMDAEMEEREAAFALKTWMPVSGPMTPESRRRDTWEPPRH